MGRKSGVLKPTEVGDKLSLLRRIAELEGDLTIKQQQTQQKIAQMQNAVKLEKDRLTELRRNLEREKHGTGYDSVPRRRLTRDSETLEKIENQLEQRLNQELATKMALKRKISRPDRRSDESPVRDSTSPKNASTIRFVPCTPRDWSGTSRDTFGTLGNASFISNERASSQRGTASSPRDSVGSTRSFLLAPHSTGRL